MSFVAILPLTFKMVIDNVHRQTHIKLILKHSKVQEKFGPAYYFFTKIRIHIFLN